MTRMVVSLIGGEIGWITVDTVTRHLPYIFAFMLDASDLIVAQ